MLKSWILWGKSVELCRNGLWGHRNSICFAVSVLSLHLLGILFAIHGSLRLCHLLGDVLGKLLVPKAVLCSHNMVGVGIFSCIVWLRNCWQEESAAITSNTWWKVKTGEDDRLLKFIPVQFCWICISWGLWIPGQHLWDGLYHPRFSMTSGSETELFKALLCCLGFRLWTHWTPGGVPCSKTVYEQKDYSDLEEISYMCFKRKACKGHMSPRLVFNQFQWMCVRLVTFRPEL